MESRKRKPLSDLTNTYNLIPTSTLRKLVASSSNSNSISKPTIPILKSNSSSNNQKFCSDSSNRSDTRSETSIGSSNVSGGRNSRSVQFRTPPRAISSITSQGGLGSKDAAYNRRKTIAKSNKEREAAVPTPVEKRKDKGKSMVVPFSSPPPEKTKGNQNEICNPCSSLERKKQKDEANFSLVSGPVEIVKESGKVILNSYSRSHEKTEKGKAILNSSGCSMGKTEEIGKGIANHSSCSPEKTKDAKKGILEKTREKGKAILNPSNIVEITKGKGSSAAVAVKCVPPRRKSERRKNDAGPSSCPPMIRTKNTQSDLDEAGAIKFSESWTDPHPKGRKKRCSKTESNVELPLDFIEHQRAYFKEVDEFELPEEEISQDELD